MLDQEILRVQNGEHVELDQVGWVGNLRESVVSRALQKDPSESVGQERRRFAQDHRQCVYSSVRHGRSHCRGLFELHYLSYHKHFQIKNTILAGEGETL